MSKDDGSGTRTTRDGLLDLKSRRTPGPTGRKVAAVGGEGRPYSSVRSVFKFSCVLLLGRPRNASWSGKRKDKPDQRQRVRPSFTSRAETDLEQLGLRKKVSEVEAVGDRF